VLRVTFHLGGDCETGTIDRRSVAEFVAAHWEGATILYGTGVWRGQVEETAVIIVYAETDARVDEFSDLLREHFRQEAVYTLVEEIPGGRAQ